MADFTQQNRPLRVTTGLGPDKLLLTGFQGREGLSQLYQFDLELMAPAGSPVAFDKVLGQPALVELDVTGGKTRFFHGVINRLSKTRRDKSFDHYRAEVVPWLWLLTRRVQSRVFQHKSVPEILEEVLEGLDPELQLQGTFHPRDYCVQYRESDFAFAARMMEEEGIGFFFRHGKDKSVLVLANATVGHPDVPIEKELIYEMTLGGNRPEGRIYEWEKVQELRSSKVTLWDHCFELPGNRLDANRPISDSVQVGTVTHKLKLGVVEDLELYSYPGEYAQRFDGVGPGGEDRAGDLEKIFQDNERVAALRMQEEAAGAVQLQGGSACGQLTAGHKFSLIKHYDANGDYLVTGVTHSARLGPNYRSGEGETLVYENRFECIPLAVPFRPARMTPRPTVHGTQTAVVVGPEGEEIFTDKYGRVKVQFHWDRQGQFNADSSCWIRVGTIWAGKNWGVVHIPRIGQEVIVDFLEGDPDQPIIIGSVYNAEQMPGGELPGKAMVSGFKSNSTPGGGGYNEFTLDDTKGKEKITVHGQYDMTTTVEHDQTTTVHNNRTTTVNVDHAETVKGKQDVTVVGNQTVAVQAKQSISVTGDRSLTVGGADKVEVTGKQHVTVGGEYKLAVTGAGKLDFGGTLKVTTGAARDTSIGGTDKLVATGAMEISAPTITISGKSAVEIICGESSIKLSPGGITIAAAKIDVNGSSLVTIVGGVVKVNS